MKQCLTAVCLLTMTAIPIGSLIAPTVFAQRKNSRSSQARPLVFTRVGVIDVTARDPRRALRLDQVVIINGDRITAVGPTERVGIPESAQVIDATGKFLVPGLWDMHVHMLDGEWETSSILNLFLANGVTGVRDMGSNLARIIALRQQIASGAPLGPRVVVSGPPIYGVGGPAGEQTFISVEEARETVRRLKKGGVDFIKLYSYLSPGAFFAAISEAKKQGLTAVGHVPFGVRASEAARAGLKSIEHLEGVAIESADLEDLLREEIRAREQGIPVRLIAADQAKRYRDSYNPERLQQLSAQFVKYHTWHCANLNLVETLAKHLVNDFAADPQLRYVPKLALWKRGFANLFSADQISNLKVYADHKRILASGMHRAGVEFLACTDAPVLGQVPGFSLHAELGSLVQAGFSPLQALQTATINPARFFGRQKEVGTVERGKLADLVLLDGNPLDEIGNTRRIDAVIVNGTYLGQEDLRVMLAAAEAEARKESIVDILLKTTIEKDVAAAVAQYRDLKANTPAAYDFRETELNTVGYRLLAMKNVGEAIEIFKLNVEMYPDSSNPYDSLGEAYLVFGDTAQAIRHYKRSVELDPENTHGLAVLKKLGAIR